MRLTIICFTLLIILSASCSKPRVFNGKSILSKQVSIEKKDDVHAFTDTCIIPYIYTKVISLRELPVDEKKAKFIQMILPSILVAQHELNEKIKRIEDIENWLDKNPKMVQMDSIFLHNLFETYHCNDIEDLKKRLKPHPASIVLGQAALETGWGSSRFFEKGNNVFGIWSYNSGENRIKALVGRDSTNIYLRKYSSIIESVNDYYGTVARVKAYNEFRHERYISKDPLSLVSFLNRYSEMGEVYTNKLRQLIKDNELTKYDSYLIKDEFLVDNIIQISQYH